MCVHLKILVLLAIVEAENSLANASVAGIDSHLLASGTSRANRHKGRSTSSSSGERGSRSSRESADDSLEISVEKVSSSGSSGEPEEKITGWRKYHRVCPPCPEDMAKKPTDKSIIWICGGYQRARRTFKSVCMMRLRNCQDGTMFVKLYDGLCKARKDGSPLGDHFFYDYKQKESEDDPSDISGSRESSNKDE